MPVPYPRRFIGCSALLVSARTVPLEHIQNTIPGGQVNGFLEKVLEKSEWRGLTFGPGGVEYVDYEQQIVEAGSEGRG